MIAIHAKNGSFSDKWIEYCRTHGMDFCSIDLFDSELIPKLRESKVTHLLFHVGTAEYRTELFLKNLVYVLEKEGIKVFPNYETFWHYDDKLSQKYLFEHLGIPHARMRVFYDESVVRAWVTQEGAFPFVFKLRGGAGSANVKLVRTKAEAIRLIRRMFTRGIYPVRSILSDARTRARKHAGKSDWLRVLKRFPKTLLKNLSANKWLAPEKGYFLVQEYLAGNQCDIRVTVLGEKACAFRRFVRPGDFRASGSGQIDFDQSAIDPNVIALAFQYADRIGGQSVAFDFIFDENGKPKVIEVSYCYVSNAVFDAGGYWTRDLCYREGNVTPEVEIIRNLLSD